MQKDGVGWSTKMQEKVDLGVGGLEFQRFAVEKVSGSVFSGEGEWKCFVLTRIYSQQLFFLKVTKWRDIAIDWLATSPKLLVVHYEHLLKDPEIQLRRIIAFLGLEADEERFSCMAGRRFERFSCFCVFVFLSGLRSSCAKALL